MGGDRHVDVDVHAAHRRGRKPLHPLPGTASDAVSRSSVGGPRVTGRVDQPVGRFKLADDLTAPGALSPADALERVLNDWDRQVLAGTIKQQTINGYKASARLLVQFVTMRKRATIADVRGSDVSDWLPTPPPGRGDPVAENSQRNRLNGARAFYTTLNTLGLHDLNPALAISVPRTYTRYVHSFTDDEIAHLKTNSRYSVDGTRAPAILALTLLGATLRENAYTRVCDIDLTRRLVWLHDGGSRSFDRWVPIDDDWAFNSLTRRINDVSDNVDPNLIPHVLVTYEQSRQHKGLNPEKEGQRRASSMASWLNKIMVKARLQEVGQTRPESIREWLAHRLFNETGRIEAVAYRLGMSSLDGVADVLRHDWRDDWAPQGTPAPPPPPLPPVRP